MTGFFFRNSSSTPGASREYTMSFVIPAIARGRREDDLNSGIVPEKVLRAGAPADEPPIDAEQEDGVLFGVQRQEIKAIF